MGNDCLSTTPNQKYQRYLGEIKVSELKDLWQTVKVYKIKKMFDGVAVPNQEYKTHTHLTFQAFKGLFPELEHYPHKQVFRLFEIFDIQNQGFVDWNSFFSTITICYFGSEKILALILFMMFDHSLEMKLDNADLKLMLDTNQFCFKTNEEGDDLEAHDIYEELKGEQGIKLEGWLKVANQYMDWVKVRKLFNIFTEQKMEKELVKYFYDWNVIYDEQRQKYIGYLINLKWFQTWRLYIFHHYNINIDIYNPIRQTIKTLKSCKKSLKMGGSSKKLGIDSSRALHGCRVLDIPREKNSQFKIKDVDCVHSHLGERPREISNGQLEGEFQEVLRGGVTENMDYVIVSEKIWNFLKNIYDGYPQFRRTGFDAIELYPKIVRVYFSLFKGHIDYSTEVVREVSSYLRIDHLLTRSCEIPEAQISNKVIYFKTIGMPKWEQLDDVSYLFTELTPDILIFLVCLPVEQKETFKKSHQKQPRDVTEVNLGDQLTYMSSTGQQTPVVFLGKSTEGKYILHFSGQSYNKDLCLLESELLKQCKLSSRLLEIQPQNRSHAHSNLMGLPSGPGLGFINSFFLHLLNCKQLKNQLVMLDHSRNDKMLYSLSRINDLLSKQARIQSVDIKDIIEMFMSKYNDFQVSMCPNFMNDLLELLSQELVKDSLNDTIGSKYSVEMEKKVTCLDCKNKTSNNYSSFILKVPIPEEKFTYYQVVWVPSEMKSSDIVRYYIKTKVGSTLGDFMNALEQQIGVKDRPYILAEVHGNDIVKNYHTATRSATLQTLKMRETDKLYAFELIVDLNTFVYNHFNNRQIVDEQEIKKDQFIDCKHTQRGWIFGKIIEIEYLPYTQGTIIKALHKFNKNQSWEISYEVFEGTVARFPIKSHKNCEQYHLRVQQRCFNQAANSMQLVNMPLVVVLPAWMRWKEFFYFIYLHVKRFIADSYSLSADALDQKTQRKATRKQNNGKTDKFKEYKNSTNFPYSLRLADYEGRCAVCFKFLKSVVFKGQNDLYCQGCQMSQNEPISWQVKPADLMICIDWHGQDRFKSNLIQENASLNKMTIEKKKQQDSLEKCLILMKQPYNINQQALCCNMLSDKENIDRIIKTSDQLVIYLERVVEQQDGFKKVVNRTIEFELQNLDVNGQKYNLIGLTSIEGEHHNIRYKTYISKSRDEWYEYDGRLVRVVDNKYIEKLCALVLYYQRAGK